MNTAEPHHWIDLCAAEQIPAEGGKFVRLQDRSLAVFRAGPDRVRVTDDTCPHAGGSLSAGHLDRQGCVVCPWHAWAFDLQTGCCPDNPTIKVRTYRSRVADGRVWIECEPGDRQAASRP